MQNIVYQFRSSAQEAVCDVCGMGLSDGVSVTACSLRNGTAMLCGSHHKA